MWFDLPVDPFLTLPHVAVALLLLRHGVTVVIALYLGEHKFPFRDCWFVIPTGIVQAGDIYLFMVTLTISFHCFWCIVDVAFPMTITRYDCVACLTRSLPDYRLCQYHCLLLLLPFLPLLLTVPVPRHSVTITPVFTHSATAHLRYLLRWPTWPLPLFDYDSRFVRLHRVVTVWWVEFRLHCVYCWTERVRFSTLFWLLNITVRLVIGIDDVR